MLANAEMDKHIESGSSRQVDIGHYHAGEARLQPFLHLLGAVAGMHGKAAKLQGLRGGYPHRLFIFNE